MEQLIKSIFLYRNISIMLREWWFKYKLKYKIVWY
jgi:hypothetical protein